MAWSMKAKYYEACNCALGCPCNMDGYPTHGRCEANVAFQVVEGDRDGVDLAGAKVAVSVKWPKAIHDGDGDMVVFIDAAEEQRDSVVAILTAADPGLPWEILASTISQIHGPYFESVHIDDAGTASRVSVPGKIEMKMETFTDPVTGEPHEAHMVLPTGFIFTDGHICTTSVNEVDADGLTFDHKGNNAYYSEVEWSSENRLAPVG
jgi:hypothetical protein